MKLQTKTPMISGENPGWAAVRGSGGGGTASLLPGWRTV